MKHFFKIIGYCYSKNEVWGIGNFIQLKENVFPHQMKHFIILFRVRVFFENFNISHNTQIEIYMIRS